MTQGNDWQTVDAGHAHKGNGRRPLSTALASGELDASPLAHGLLDQFMLGMALTFSPELPIAEVFGLPRRAA